ncbi:hypothetical protein EHP00_1788 [Ecytonucleospora hepatopenaei]|uniref:Uncharacterized protein n=1 Tax=Ecytonucleospora hepatopenaei TaxID=646526 RepID=A0A1W0E4B8_9MICR|nr:hypothetical protein EHP00_1788 [Ecytonucleospora hepatopenaei]
MLPEDFKKVIDQAAEEYQALVEENARLKFNNDKLREELTKVTKLSNNRFQYVSDTNNSSTICKQVTVRGSDYTIEGKSFLRLTLLDRLQYKAPISNIKTNGDFLAFSCNKKIFVGKFANSMANNTLLLEKNKCVPYDVSLMKYDLVEYFPRVFEWWNEHLLCIFNNEVVLYDVISQKKIDSLVFDKPKLLCKSTENRFFVYVRDESKKSMIVEILFDKNGRLSTGKEVDAPKNIKSFQQYNEEIFIFITSYSIGIISNQIYETKTMHRNNVLFIHKNTVYIGGVSSGLKVFLVNNQVNLEQVDIIRFSKNIFSINSYMQNLLFISCSGGLTYIYNTDINNTMLIRTNENVIDMAIYDQTVFMLEASGHVKKFYGTELRSNPKKD